MNSLQVSGSWLDGPCRPRQCGRGSIKGVCLHAASRSRTASAGRSLHNAKVVCLHCGCRFHHSHLSTPTARSCDPQLRRGQASVAVARPRLGRPQPGRQPGVAMPKKRRETATSSAVVTLTLPADREMRVSDLLDLCKGRYSREKHQQLVGQVAQRGQGGARQRRGQVGLVGDCPRLTACPIASQAPSPGPAPARATAR